MIFTSNQNEKYWKLIRLKSNLNMRISLRLTTPPYLPCRGSLVFDRESGKPRGYGFCEYLGTCHFLSVIKQPYYLSDASCFPVRFKITHKYLGVFLHIRIPFSYCHHIVTNVYQDHETAQSAVRNLNAKDVGGRPLRIDLADSDPLLEGRTTSHGELLDDRRRPAAPAPSTESWLTGLPQGSRLPPGKTSTDVITDVLTSTRPEQVYDVLRDMKVCFDGIPYTSRADSASVVNYVDLYTAATRPCTYPSSGQPAIGVRIISSRLAPQCHRPLCYPRTPLVQILNSPLRFIR